MIDNSQQNKLVEDALSLSHFTTALRQLIKLITLIAHKLIPCNKY